MSGREFIGEGAGVGCDPGVAAQGLTLWVLCLASTIFAGSGRLWLPGAGGVMDGRDAPRSGRSALRRLPDRPNVFAEWKAVRAYHVKVDGHYCSVSHALVRRQLDVRLRVRTVECFGRGQRVASDVRSSEEGRHTKRGEHVPEQHRGMGDWTRDRVIEWGGKPDRTPPPWSPPSSPGGIASRPTAPASGSSAGQVLRRRPPGSGRRTGAGRRQLQLRRRRIDPPSATRRGPGEPPEPAEPVEHEKVRGAIYYQ